MGPGNEARNRYSQMTWQIWLYQSSASKTRQVHGPTDGYVDTSTPTYLLFFQPC